MFQDRINLALTFIQICLPKEEELGHAFQDGQEESRAPPGDHLVSSTSESLSMLGMWFLSLRSVLLTRYRVAVLCFTVPLFGGDKDVTRHHFQFGPCPELHLV